MKIAVAGGTGVTGRHVTESVRAAGHTAVVLSRSAGVDLLEGHGLADALRGVSAVIDVTNTTTTRRARSVAFFGTVTRNLLAAEQQAGTGHHVALSIIGTDRVDFGYYLGKRRQEELVLAGPVPGSVLRTTQFHEFAGQLLDRVRGPVALAPQMLSQPVAAAEAAAALVGLALAGPAGLAPELAGRRSSGWRTWSAGWPGPAASTGRCWRSAFPARPGRRWPGAGSCRRARDRGAC